VFYDFDYQPHLARPNIDVLLQTVYRKQSDLVVVFTCEEYAKKEWCGLEWRAVRDMIKSKQDDQIMLVRFDDTLVEGLFGIDGYVDARRFSPREMATMIRSRLSTVTSAIEDA
jgi:hypothetical protein